MNLIVKQLYMDDICHNQKTLWPIRATSYISIGRKLTSKRASLLNGYSTEVSQVALIADKHDNNIRIGMIMQFLQPPIDILKGEMLGNIIYNESTNGTTIVPTQTAPTAPR